MNTRFFFALAAFLNQAAFGDGEGLFSLVNRGGYGRDGLSPVPASVGQCPSPVAGALQDNRRGGRDGAACKGRSAPLGTAAAEQGERMALPAPGSPSAMVILPARMQGYHSQRASCVSTSTRRMSLRFSCSKGTSLILSKKKRQEGILPQSRMCGGDNRPPCRPARPQTITWSEGFARLACANGTQGLCGNRF